MKFFEYLKEAEGDKAKVEYITPTKGKHYIPLKGTIVDNDKMTEVKITSLQGMILIAHLLSKLPKTEKLSDGDAEKVAKQVLAFTKKGSLEAGIALPRMTKEVYDAATKFFFSDVAVTNSALHKYMKEIVVFSLNKEDISKSLQYKDIVFLIKKEHDLISFDAGEGSSEVSKEEEEGVKEFQKEVLAKVDELKIGAVGKTFSGKLPGIKGASAYYFIGSTTPNIALFGEIEGKEFIVTMPATKENTEEVFSDGTKSHDKRTHDEIADSKKVDWENAERIYWNEYAKKSGGVFDQLSDDQKKKLKDQNINNKKDFIEFSKQRYLKKEEKSIKASIKELYTSLQNKVQDSFNKANHEEVVKYLTTTFGVKGGYSEDFNNNLFQYVKDNQITRYAVNKDVELNVRITDIKTFIKKDFSREEVTKLSYGDVESKSTIKAGTQYVKINPNLAGITATLKDMKVGLKDIHVVTHMVKGNKESKNTIEDVLGDKEINDTEKKDKKASSNAAYRSALDSLEVEGKDNPFIGFASGVVTIRTIINVSLNIHKGIEKLQVFGKCLESGSKQDKFFVTDIAVSKSSFTELSKLLFKNAEEVIKNVMTTLPLLKKRIELVPGKPNVINLGKVFEFGDKTTKTVKPELVSGGVKVEVMQIKGERKIVDKFSFPSFPHIVYAGSKINSKEVDWNVEKRKKAVDNEIQPGERSKLVGFSNKFSGASYLVIKGKA